MGLRRRKDGFGEEEERWVWGGGRKMGLRRKKAGFEEEKRWV